MQNLLMMRLYAGFQGAATTNECSGAAYAKTIFMVQALNTVLAFVSSRKHLATTFPVIRSSVEGLLKRSSAYTILPTLD